MTLLVWLLAVALAALWRAQVRRYPVAPRRRAAAQTGAAVLALTLALDASAAAAAPSYSGDHYLEAHAPAAWSSAQAAGLDGWFV